MGWFKPGNSHEYIAQWYDGTMRRKLKLVCVIRLISTTEV